MRRRPLLRKNRRKFQTGEQQRRPPPRKGVTLFFFAGLVMVVAYMGDGQGALNFMGRWRLSWRPLKYSSLNLLHLT